MSAFLASVRDLAEAKLAYRVGAEWIDLKEPASGALGAVAPHTVAEVVTWTAVQERHVALSATIGDCWDTLSVMPSRVETLHAVGVDHAKIGIFAACPSAELLQTIRQCCVVGVKVILVCFAEEPPDPTDINAYAACGIAGVMLDTANKTGPSLTGLLSTKELGEFVATVHRHDLICGLAGSLVLSDVDKLSALKPDYLGFRGALCSNAVRESQFSYAAAMRVRECLDNSENRDGKSPADQNVLDLSGAQQI